MIWLKDGGYGGFLGGMLGELCIAMNFTISELMWEDVAVKWNTDHSKLGGVFARVYRREVDLGLSVFFMTNERSELVSYTSPIHLGPLQLIIRKYDTAHLVWNAHFKVRQIIIKHNCSAFFYDLNSNDGLFHDSRLQWMSG